MNSHIIKSNIYFHKKRKVTISLTKNAIKKSPKCTYMVTQLSSLLENVSTSNSATASPPRRHCGEKQQHFYLGPFLIITTQEEHQDLES